MNTGTSIFPSERVLCILFGKHGLNRYQHQDYFVNFAWALTNEMDRTIRRAKNTEWYVDDLYKLLQLSNECLRDARPCYSYLCLDSASRMANSYARKYRQWETAHLRLGR